MLLAIDIGNSNIAFGIYSDRWKRHWRLNTVADKTADEYEVLFRSLLNSVQQDPAEISQVVVSSVVPPLTSTFVSMIRSVFSVEPLIVNGQTNTGIKVSIDNPLEIGSDLLANAVAGYHKYQDKCIVVDFGTALSITIVGVGGVLLGGSIAPGLKTSMKALTSNTAQLPFVQLEVPNSAIGKNTVHAIQSGMVLGYIGLVESLIKRIKAELGEDAKVIATGGLSEVIAPHTQEFDALEPWHTLEGLRLIAEKNTN